MNGEIHIWLVDLVYCYRGWKEIITGCLLGHYFVVIGITDSGSIIVAPPATTSLTSREALGCPFGPPYRMVEYVTVSVMMMYCRTSQLLIHSSALAPTISSSPPPSSSAKYGGLACLPALLEHSTSAPPAESTNHNRCRTVGLTSSHHPPIHPATHLHRTSQPHRNHPLWPAQQWPLRMGLREWLP